MESQVGDPRDGEIRPPSFPGNQGEFRARRPVHPLDVLALEPYGLLSSGAQGAERRRGAAFDLFHKCAAQMDKILGSPVPAGNRGIPAVTLRPRPESHDRETRAVGGKRPQEPEGEEEKRHIYRRYKALQKNAATLRGKPRRGTKRKCRNFFKRNL